MTSRTRDAIRDSREARGRVLARNTLWNLVGQAVPLVTALVTMPYIIRKLGPAAYGVLSIAWVLIDYFGLFDFGVGRATTKYVAEHLGRGKTGAIPGLIWTSLGLQTLLGIAGSLVLACAVPILVDHVLKVPLALVRETKTMLFLLAASLPTALATNALVALLAAAQRFDLINKIGIPFGMSGYLVSVLALYLGFHLPGLMFLLVLVRFVTATAFMISCLSVFPALRAQFVIERKKLYPLIRYGGWITASNAVSPLLTYIDRFVIGNLRSVASVGYYAAPYEAVSKLQLIPAALVGTLFPAFSTIEAAGDRRKLDELHTRSIKSLVLVLGPLALIMIAFGREILTLWLGRDFGGQSTLAFQILSVGFFINGLGFIPYNLLQGTGRPDLTAKFHFGELPIYLVALWILVGKMGITGAALATSARLILDSALMFAAAFRLRLTRFDALVEFGFARSAFAVGVFGAVFSLATLTPHLLLTRALWAASLIILFGFCVWTFVLDDQDRSLVASVMGRFWSFGDAA